MKATAVIRPLLPEAEVYRDFEFSNLGISLTRVPGTLSFAVNRRYLREAATNPNVCGVITTREALAQFDPDRLGIVLSPDPMASFFRLHIDRCEHAQNTVSSVIDATATICPTAYIAEVGVTIGPMVEIGPNAVIHERVSIGAGSAVRANAVVGTQGFEPKPIGRDGCQIIVPHDGSVRIGYGVEIQAGTCIDRGIYGEETIIGDHTLIDNLCHISHNCHVGSDCLIIAHAVLCGSVTVGDAARIGPGAVISNGVTIGAGARVSLGSTVVRDVPAATTVSGYFAVEHSEYVIRDALNTRKWQSRRHGKNRNDR